MKDSWSSADIKGDGRAVKSTRTEGGIRILDNSKEGDKI
jgi:hypothetical protein